MPAAHEYRIATQLDSAYSVLLFFGFGGRQSFVDVIGANVDTRFHDRYSPEC